MPYHHLNPDRDAIYVVILLTAQVLEHELHHTMNLVRRMPLQDRTCRMLDEHRCKKRVLPTAPQLPFFVKRSASMSSLIPARQHASAGDCMQSKKRQSCTRQVTSKLSTKEQRATFCTDRDQQRQKRDHFTTSTDSLCCVFAETPENWLKSRGQKKRWISVVD